MDKCTLDLLVGKADQFQLAFFSVECFLTQKQKCASEDITWFSTTQATTVDVTGFTITVTAGLDPRRPLAVEP